MVAISFWERAGLLVRPAFTLAAYRDFFQGVRLSVLERSLIVSCEAPLISLLIAYPIAYFLAFKASVRTSRAVLLLFAVPFLINYIIRTFVWTLLLGRTGPVNASLMALGLTNGRVDWLLYRHFDAFLRAITFHTPLMD